MSLADRHCLEARSTAPLPPAHVAALLAQVPAWQVHDGRRLRRELRFSDFAAALACVNLLGAEAERQGHHPDLGLSWGRVTIELTTHDLGGLSEADFILAARFDRLLAGAPAPGDR